MAFVEEAMTDRVLGTLKGVCWRRMQQVERVHERDHALDIIKGICILFVVVTHQPWTTEQRRAMGFPFWIDMAVPLFLIISGYVSACYLKRKNPETIEKAYTKNWVLKSAIRYTVPFLFMHVVECLIDLRNHVFAGKKDFIQAVFYRFVQGGVGPGSYYYPIMMQFILIFPIIYFAIKNYREKGLLGCFVTNFLFEVLRKPFYLGEETYRLLIFRYLFVIAMGCYFSLYPDLKSKKVNVVSFVVGIAFIVVTSYCGYTPLIFDSWTGTSMIAVLYIGPLFKLILAKMHVAKVRMPLLEKIGTSTYNILVVQMVYYTYFYAVIANKVQGYAKNVLVAIFLCVPLGILVTFLEKPLLKKLESLC